MRIPCRAPARRLPHAAGLLLLILYSLLTQRAAATTVVRVDVDYLVEHAGLIFEGEVIAHDAAFTPRSPSAWTR